MPLASLGFLVGVLICQSLTELPMREWSFLIIFLLPLILRFPKYRFAIFLLIGFLYSVLIAHSKLDTQISPHLTAKDLLITGVISKVTQTEGNRSRFWLLVNDLSEFHDADASKSTIPTQLKYLPRKIQLSWYNDSPSISVGQRWQLKVRLKQARGFSNPGGFDYEAWLYQNAIDATGYVRSGKQHTRWNNLLATESGPLIAVHQLREKLSLQIQSALQAQQHTSLIRALVIGDRQTMTDRQWSTLTNTGTNHLMAISGLHIGLVAGLAFFFVMHLWRFIPRAPLIIPAPRAAAVAAIVFALCYAALAGFTLPTQRALIMICVAMLAVWYHRSFMSSQILAAALLVVLLYDPTAVLNGSFWLSFAAVAVIVFTLSNRTTAQTLWQKWWWKWGRVQWVIAIGLAPILLFWFQQVPLISPLANFIAVPVVSFFTVPLSLLGATSLLLEPAMGQFILKGAHLSLDLLWPLLDAMADIDGFTYRDRQPPLWTLLPALIGTLWLLAPNGLPARSVGVIWLLPLVFFPRTDTDIAYGTYRFTLLDVGHGLAVVVRTQNHVMLYDAGPRYSESFNAGQFAVVPFLKRVGINQIDTLILSHNDIDHVGGYAGLTNDLVIKQLSIGPGVVIQDHSNLDQCVEGQSWRWDGVQFQVLHPSQEYNSRKDNNNSCVVQISTENDKLLLTGDIEREVEREFVKFFAKNDDNLRADVLVVPHHGSLSSSSDAFVQAVKPEYALISAGYKNRYGLPKPQVVERYQGVGSRILNTAELGAISFLMGKNGLSELSLHRHQARHYWTSVTK